MPIDARPGGVYRGKRHRTNDRLFISSVAYSVHYYSPVSSAVVFRPMTRFTIKYSIFRIDYQTGSANCFLYPSQSLTTGTLTNHRKVILVIIEYIYRGAIELLTTSNVSIEDLSVNEQPDITGQMPKVPLLSSGCRMAPPASCMAALL